MAIELVCSCGQVLRFDEPPPGGQARCPDCNKVLTIEDDRSILATLTDLPDSRERPPAVTRKPLWQVMARDQDRLEGPQSPGGNAKETIAYDAETGPPAAESSGPNSGRKKGLWSLMQSPAPGGATPGVEPQPTGPIQFESVPDPDLREANPGAGTDSIRNGPPGLPEGRSKSEIPLSNLTGPKSEINVAAEPTANSESSSHSLAEMFGIAADEALQSAQTKAAGFQADNSRRALAAAIMGGLSIPLSGVAFVNAAWSRMPATALGFVAILTGLIASQEIERSGGRKRGRRLAIAGIATGVFGVFLGPLVIAPFGRPKKDR